MATLAACSWSRASGLVCATWLLGCGDALVDRTFFGEPLITVRGNVGGSSDALPLENPLLRVSVWWSPLGPSVTDYSQLIEQPSITTQSAVPFSFTLNVFDRPAAGHWTVLPDGTRYALGTMLGFYDENGNGRRDEPERLLGSTRRLLLYTEQPLNLHQSPVGLALQPGYYLTSNSFACPPTSDGMSTQPPPPPPMQPGQDCSQGLSQACTQDSDCSPGICVRDFVAPWPQGGCVLPDPLPEGCSPQGAVRVVSPASANATMRRDVAYWVKACASSADCGRSFPYQCDASLGACLPTQVVVVTLSDSLPAPRWCR